MNPDNKGGNGGLDLDLLDQAQRLLGNQNLTEAETIVRTVLVKDKTNPRALDLLGQIAAGAGDSQAALNLFYQAYQSDPSKPDYLNNLALVLADLQHIEKAIEALDNSFELDPTNSAGRNQKAALLVSLGRNDEAIEVARQAIEMDPDNGGGYWLLAYLDAIEPGSDLHLGAMLLAEQESAGCENRAHANYALGYSYRRAGDDALFMKHIEEGNLLQQQAPVPVEARERNLTEEVQAHLPRHRRLLDDTDAEPRFTPIFVVGMPRSGTSLVEQILSSHGDVHGAGELTLVRNGIVRRTGILAGKPFPAALVDLNPEQLGEIADLILGKLQRLAASKRFIVDKNPWNFQMIGAFQAILPEARIVHIARRPLDNCFSIYTNYFSSLDPHFTDQTALGTYYRNYHQLMDFWRQEYPDRIYDLEYERLVEDFEPEARKLLDYCGLPWSDSVLEFHSSDRPVRTLSANQVRRPINPDSIGKAERYRDYLGPLIESLGDLAKA